MSDCCPLEVVDLGRCFDDFWAVRSLDFRLVHGEIYGFLGPNGAGKSTTIKMITGLIKPTEGYVRLFGLDPIENEVDVKKLIGVVPEHLQMYDRLTGREFLEFAARMYQVPESHYNLKIKEFLHLLDLDSKADIQIKDYSNGMKKKTALAAALLHDPKILFLDEPFTGMDAMSVIKVRRLIKKLCDQGTTIFFSSHILEVVEKLCDRMAIIVNGNLCEEGTAQQMLDAYKVKNLEDLFLSLAPTEGLRE